MYPCLSSYTYTTPCKGVQATPANISARLCFQLSLAVRHSGKHSWHWQWHRGTRLKRSRNRICDNQASKMARERRAVSKEDRPYDVNHITHQNFLSRNNSILKVIVITCEGLVLLWIILILGKKVYNSTITIINVTLCLN